jgi:hypothetical protein
MPGFEFLRKWLIADGVLILVLGIFLVSLSTAPDPAGDPFTSIFWKQGISEGARDFYAWAFGVWGATLMGWATTLLFLAAYPLKKREVWVVNCITASMAIWYPVDTFISIRFGVVLNCVLNTVLLLLVAIPLLGIWRGICKTGAPPLNL